MIIDPTYSTSQAAIAATAPTSPAVNTAAATAARNTVAPGASMPNALLGLASSFLGGSQNGMAGVTGLSEPPPSNTQNVTAKQGGVTISPAANTGFGALGPVTISPAVSSGGGAAAASPSVTAPMTTTNGAAGASKLNWGWIAIGLAVAAAMWLLAR